MSLIAWNLQKQNNEVLCMLFQKTQMSFNETDHVMQHTIMKIVTANGAKMTHKMLQ